MGDEEKKFELVEPEDLNDCWLCQEVSDGEMIQCDECPRGFHRVCIGKLGPTPGQKISEGDEWRCPPCQQKRVQETILKDQIVAAQSEREDLLAKITELEKAVESVRMNTGGHSSANYWPSQALAAQETLLKATAAQTECLKTLTASISKQPVVAGTSNFDEFRKILKKNAVPELPVFEHGEAHEYIIFKKRFEASTKEFGLNNYDNLARLDAKIRGKPRENIELLLLDPANVPKIMETLEEIYGSPLLLYRGLTKNFKRVPPPARHPGKIIEFTNRLKELIDGLEFIGWTQYLINPELQHYISNNLPRSMKEDWAEKLKENDRLRQAAAKTEPPGEQPELLGLKDIYEYLADKGASRRYLETLFDEPENRKAYSDEKKRGVYVNLHQMAEKGPNKPKGEQNKSFPCLFCKKDNHASADCYSLKNMKDEKIEEILGKKYFCFNCMKGKHKAKKCNNSRRCEVPDCGKKHHTLLHDRCAKNESKNEKNNKKENETKNNTTFVGVHHGITESEHDKNDDPNASNANNILVGVHSGAKKGKVIYGFIPLTLTNPKNGISTKAVGVLDPCSGATMLDQATYDLLGLKGQKKTLVKVWTNGIKSTCVDSKVTEVEITGPSGVRHLLRHVRTNNDSKLPKMEYPENLHEMSHLKGVPKYDGEGKPTVILIGLEHGRLFLGTENRIGKFNEPVATKTSLGWVIFGPNREEGDEPLSILSHAFEEEEGEEYNIMHHAVAHDDPWKDFIKNFYTTENFGVVKREAPCSQDEEKAEQILKETTKRVGNAYEVGLLWKENAVLPNVEASYFSAKKRLEWLEKRMKKDEGMEQWMKTQIDNYVKKGYARKLTEEELNDKTIQKISYVPIFYVINPNKEVFKPRIVFDFAAKTNGVSLNDCFYTGRDRMPQLFSKLNSFRIGKVGVCGDIEQMFHRVKIRQADQHAQRFLWRDGNTSKMPEVYVLQVLAFGPTGSPSTAMYVKNTNAKRYEETHPEAYKSIISDYVDNNMESYDNVEDAIRITNDIININLEGNFNTRDFVSNSLEVVSKLPKDKVASIQEYHFLDENKSEKLLGIKWDVKNDVFTFNIKELIEQYQLKHKINFSSQVITKRIVTSFIWSIFDPLGWLNHWTITGKIMVQDIWRNKSDWDDPLKEEDKRKWDEFLEMISQKPKVDIDRCFSPRIRQAKRLELHVFCDASDKAFATVIYLRIQHSKNDVEVRLVAAKARVAPLKALSVPKLELQASVLGTRLHKVVKKDLEGANLMITDTFFWTDSMVVLQWIKSMDRRYKMFVAHRVGEILEETEERQWNHVPTDMNAADEATKLTTGNMWFKGPEFLRKKPELWPNRQINLETKHEEEVEVLAIEVQEESLRTVELGFRGSNKDKIIDVTCFSRWEDVVRRVAIYQKFINWLKNGKKLKARYITVSEKRNAELTLCRFAQQEQFGMEYKLLQKEKQIEKNSLLRNLNPYFGHGNVIRHFSRLVNTHVPADKARPIILPQKHHVTKLLIDYYHRVCFHSRIDTVIAMLRNKFYIPHVREMIRKAVNRCQRCKNKKAPIMSQQMSTLPEVRTLPFEKAFTRTGIDMFGPIEVTVKRSVVKRYGMIFTCLATRAIHLEVAQDASTDAFMTCLLNFIGRRGEVLLIMSDNGTNFVSAASELERQCAANDIVFQTIPPLSPHKGGAWESLIKQVKGPLMAMIEKTRPNDYKLISYFIQVESLINSRPLVEIPVDYANEDILTPNHFLLGAGAGKISRPFEYLDVGNRRQWRQIVELTAGFWRLWIQRYLPTLLKRNKWLNVQQPLQIGDVVYIVDPNKPREGWALGIVEETYPSRDNLVRTALIRSKGKVYKRSITSLVRLEVRKPETIQQEPEEEIVLGLVMIEDSHDSSQPENVTSHQCSTPVQSNTLIDQGEKIDRQPYLDGTQPIYSEKSGESVENKTSNNFVNFIMFILIKFAILKRYVQGRQLLKIGTKFCKMLLFASIFSLLFGQTQGQILTPVNRSGLIMSKIGPAFATIGTMRIHVNTTYEPSKDLRSLQDQIRNTDDACIRLEKMYGHDMCTDELGDLKELVRVTRLTKRVKRHGGAIGLLKWALFGSNEQAQELQALKERERLLELHTKHVLEIAVNSLHKTENRTANKMAQIGKRTNAILEHLATMEDSLNTMTKRDAHLQVRVLVEALKVHFEDLRAKYQLLYQGTDLLTDEELSRNLHLLKGKMSGNMMLPTLSLPELRNVMSVEILEKFEPLMMIIHVPAVYKETFEYLNLVAVPDPLTGMTFEIEDNAICVNEASQTYFYIKRDARIQSVNDTFVIENREFASGRQQLDCVTSHVFDNKRAVLENCKTYDWKKDTELVELPNNNQYLVITSRPKTVSVKCEDNFVELPKSTGSKLSVILMTLHAGCEIMTGRGFTIMETTLTVNGKMKGIHFSETPLEHIALKALKNLTSIEPLANDTFIVEKDKILEDTIEQELAVVSVDDVPKNNMLIWGLGGTSVVLLLTIVGVGIGFCVCYKKGEKVTDVEEHIELPQRQPTIVRYKKRMAERKRQLEEKRQKFSINEE